MVDKNFKCNKNENIIIRIMIVDKIIINTIKMIAIIIIYI